jgi:hypothetical protein
LQEGLREAARFPGDDELKDVGKLQALQATNESVRRELVGLVDELRVFRSSLDSKF